jgi:hypothetical protein
MTSDLILWRSMVVAAQRSAPHHARPISWLARLRHLRVELRSIMVMAPVGSHAVSRRDTRIAGKE